MNEPTPYWPNDRVSPARTPAGAAEPSESRRLMPITLDQDFTMTATITRSGDAGPKAPTMSKEAMEQMTQKSLGE